MLWLLSAIAFMDIIVGGRLVVSWSSQCPPLPLPVVHSLFHSSELVLTLQPTSSPGYQNLLHLKILTKITQYCSFCYVVKNPAMFADEI